MHVIYTKRLSIFEKYPSIFLEGNGGILLINPTSIRFPCLGTNWKDTFCLLYFASVLASRMPYGVLDPIMSPNEGIQAREGYVYIVTY